MKFLVTIDIVTASGKAVHKVVSVNTSTADGAIALANVVEAVYARRFAYARRFEGRPGGPQKMSEPQVIPVVIEGGGVPEETTLEDAILWALTSDE